MVVSRLTIILIILVVASATLSRRLCSSFSFPEIRSRCSDGGGIGVEQNCGQPCSRQSPPRVSNCFATPTDTEPYQCDIDNVQRAIDKFISTLQESLDDGSFESFALKGPSAPRKRRKNKVSNNHTNSGFDLEQQREMLRGKFKAIYGRLVLLQKKKKSKGKKEAPADGRGDAGSLHIQATIKYHLATDIAKNWKVCRKKNFEKTEVEEGLRQLFLTSMGLAVNENSVAHLSEWGAQNINGDLGILSGELITLDGVHKLRLQPRHKASFRLSKKKLSHKTKSTSSQKTNSSSRHVNDFSRLSHDRSKAVPLPPSSEFFQKLGVSNVDGKPVNGMASKLRQCQKFVEIVGNLVQSSASAPSRIRVIDMGCGRGYLTFSLHSYLCNKFEAKQGNVSIETQGIDRRPKLIAEINGIARELGGSFATLNFIEGTIGETHNHNSLFEKYKLDQNVENVNSLYILIALHACDTATDDALWCAIGQDADIIVTAPCCQHELRPQIDRHVANNPNHPLSDILRHAIYRERSTEVVTDAMRAILLEIAGYTTRVFEFIGGKHTAKNVMITATKLKRPRGNEEQEDLRQRLRELAELHGIKRQRLAMLMGESTVSEGGNKPKIVNRNLSGMAPLDL